MNSRLKEGLDLLLFVQMPPRLMYSILIGIYKNIYLGHQKCNIKNLTRVIKLYQKILHERGVEKLGISSKD